MANDARAFALGTILSITTDVLVAPNLMKDVHDILNFMSGDKVMTHQMPRVADQVRAAILRQHPQLTSVSDAGIGRDNWKPWLDSLIRDFGETLTLTPMTANEHERIDPVSELAEVVHPDKIIQIGEANG